MLDSVFAEFKWYRALRGGQWHHVYLKYAHGIPDWWERGEKPTPESRGVTLVVIDSEYYKDRHDISKTSDGYHTFDELYQHRHLLFCAFLKYHGGWKSRLNSDGSSYDGWFIAGTEVNGKQISYHLPDEFWDLCPVQACECPAWDGHSSFNVIDRLKNYLSI